ncbi:MarC family protein [Novosphingobium sp.]|uniref:MarC family protein n=1 Tax=Novosphingobium sp. TaxID=1874826 RepID=UPI00333EF469
MVQLFLSAFITLFVVIDPPGCAPIYAGLIADATPRQAMGMALRASLIAAGILVGFALFGAQLLAAMHIELDSFRIAGGIMLFLLALDMVLDRNTERRSERAEQVKASRPVVKDVAVFPMAMPILAGPGSIASIMLLMARAHGATQISVILAALATVMALAFAAMVAARPIIRLLGAQIEAVVTRLLGVLLAALAAQFVIDGIKGQLF